jgi:uncharacterized protein
MSTPKDEQPAAGAAEVLDEAEMLSAGELASLRSQVAEHNAEGLGLVTVLLAPRLPAGLTIEEYAEKVLHDALALPGRRADRVVILLSLKERLVRIQVSSALWAVLPDEYCKLVIERDMTPQFRAGKYAAGLSRGVSALTARLSGRRW